ncbi:MAG: hypothetical protein AB8F65_12675 [Woeseiaceae bacterium]
MNFQDRKFPDSVSVVTFFFAVLPATIACSYALLAVMIGIGALFSGSLLGILLALWGVGGLIGTLSLWLAAGRYYRDWMIGGLLVGLVSFLPLTFQAVKEVIESSARGISMFGSVTEAGIVFCAISVPVLALVQLVRATRAIDKLASEDQLNHHTHITAVAPDLSDLA